MGNASTDTAWEEWGRLEPYFGVLTNPKYKMSAMDSEARRQFFESGKTHVDSVMRSIREHVVSEYNPGSVLEFGCGVGRLVIPFARLAHEVVGLDVSSAMLDKARDNCKLEGLTNVKLELSDDSLSAVSQKFDLVHSAIVLQHIPIDRGKLIFRRLLDCIAPGGVAAIQLLYAKTAYANTHGVAPPPVPPRKPRWYQVIGKRKQPVDPPPAHPEMQMNPYNLNELFFFMQERGIHQFHSQFTDHGGELGLWLFFRAA